MFDQLIKDALNFIKRLLTWRSRNSRQSERKPFTAMRSHSGEWGVISLVIGRDTPRSVRTWIYSPKRWEHSETKKKVKETPQDLHFYLDFLGPMPKAQTSLAKEEKLARQEKRRRGQSVPTHRIQVLKASHFLNDEGVYDCELIFWGDFDFQMVGSFDPKKEAIMVTDKVVSMCLRMTDPFKLSKDDWQMLIIQMWNHVRGDKLDVSKLPAQTQLNPTDSKLLNAHQSSPKQQRSRAKPRAIQ